MTMYIKWAWRRRRLEAEWCETLKEAVSSAKYGRDTSVESFDSIEGPRGVVDSAEVRRIWDQLDQEKDGARRPPYTHRVLLRHPTSGGTATVAWAYSYLAAADRAAALVSQFGDRVSVENVNAGVSL